MFDFGVFKQVIEKIHQIFFGHDTLDEADVRQILASEQRKILAGCRIVFSRVFPVGEAHPQMHPLWKSAEQFGAECTTHLDEQVTHVVANSLGTDKVFYFVFSQINPSIPCYVMLCLGKNVDLLLYR